MAMGTVATPITISSSATAAVPTAMMTATTTTTAAITTSTTGEVPVLRLQMSVTGVDFSNTLTKIRFENTTVKLSQATRGIFSYTASDNSNPSSLETGSDTTRISADLQYVREDDANGAQSIIRAPSFSAELLRDLKATDPRAFEMAAIDRVSATYKNPSAVVVSDDGDTNTGDGIGREVVIGIAIGLILVGVIGAGVAVFLAAKARKQTADNEDEEEDDDAADAHSNKAVVILAVST